MEVPGYKKSRGRTKGTEERQGEKKNYLPSLEKARAYMCGYSDVSSKSPDFEFICGLTGHSTPPLLRERYWKKIPGVMEMEQESLPSFPGNV